MGIFEADEWIAVRELSSRAKRGGGNNGADRLVRPILMRVVKGYTSFHHGGFNTFHL